MSSVDTYAKIIKGVSLNRVRCNCVSCCVVCRTTVST